MRPWTALAALAAVAALVAGSGEAAAPLPGNAFQVTSLDHFLAGGDGAGKALVPQAPAEQGASVLVAPGVSALGVVDQPATDAWTSAAGWEKDLEVTDAARAVLYFTANVQALTLFQVRLYDVAPDGTPRLVAQEERQFITALRPTPVTFDLHAQGGVLHRGHVLRLEVHAQTASALVVLHHGGATPSGLHDLRVRWLDSDGDGVSDSDEVAAGTNPLDPTDQRANAGPDSDGDGCSDTFEGALGTNADVADTDGDGYGDCLETHAGSSPLDPASRPYDEDGDGLPDVFEAHYFLNRTVGGGLGPSDDPDGDGCANLCEAERGTNPFNPDTDGDGIGDGDETPTGPTSFTVRGSGMPEPVASAAFFAVGTSVALAALLRRP